MNGYGELYLDKALQLATPTNFRDAASFDRRSSVIKTPVLA